MVNKVLNQIKSIYPKMTKSEKKIAEYILDYYESIINLSVVELSSLSDVGETTIFRFCKKLGYKGYPEFKITLAQDIVSTKAFLKGSESEHFKNDIKNTIVSEIQHTDMVLDVKKIDKVVDMISESKRVFLFGIGGSALAARAAQDRLLRIGILSDSLTESHEQGMLASILTEDDLIIVFSISGNTKGIVDNVRIAKKNNVKIIAITSHVQSSLTESADVVLQTAVTVNFIEGGSLVATISQFYVIDVIVTGLVLKNTQKSLQMRRKTGLSLIGKTFDEIFEDEHK